MLPAFMSLANPFGLAVQSASVLTSIYFPWMIPCEEEQTVFDHTEVGTDKCGSHVHITSRQEQLAFEALGMEHTEKLWMSFVKKPLAIGGEIAMRVSFYARRTHGELYRFGWVRSETPRSFCQAECAPTDYKQLIGKAHGKDRMSGELEGVEAIEIVAVQLDFDDIVPLATSFSLPLIVPRLHAHVPMTCKSREITVRYGDQLVTMPAKPSLCKGVLIHPHSADYARLMAAVEQSEQEVREAYYAAQDEPFAAAAGGLW